MKLTFFVSLLLLGAFAVGIFLAHCKEASERARGIQKIRIVFSEDPGWNDLAHMILGSLFALSVASAIGIGWTAAIVATYVVAAVSGNKFGSSTQNIEELNGKTEN